jgi:hypothetical protein
VDSENGVGVSVIYAIAIVVVRMYNCYNGKLELVSQNKLRLSFIPAVPTPQVMAKWAVFVVHEQHSMHVTKSPTIGGQ